ncbi:hypothetical protein NL316_27625, partial [Klebsiella pneumoniae]|nr:hypothetical protein [Klebsiella pneumoniae]
QLLVRGVCAHAAGGGETMLYHHALLAYFLQYQCDAAPVVAAVQSVVEQTFVVPPLLTEIGILHSLQRLPSL